VTEPAPEPVEDPNAAAIRGLGFDPSLVRAVVVTPTSAVAISVDYPEPYRAPEEAP